LKGKLRGQEDLVIEGTVQGKIVLRQASITVGERGRVEGNISAKSVTLENGYRFKRSIDMESQTKPRSIKEEHAVVIPSVGTGRA